jgi:hypothetical protein
MAVPVWETGTSVVGNGVTSFTCTKPTGLADTDTLYFTISKDGQETLSVPSGSSLIANCDHGDNTARIYRKVVTDAASEPADYSFSWTGSQHGNMTCSRVSNAHNTTPEDVTIVVNTGSGATATATGITTINNDCLLFMFTGTEAGQAGAISEPAGSTQRFDLASSGGGAETRASQSVATAGLATAGATGDKDFGLVLSDSWGACIVAIRSADAGGGGAETIQVPTIQYRVYVGDQIGRGISVPTVTYTTSHPTITVTKSTDTASVRGLSTTKMLIVLGD